MRIETIIEIGILNAETGKVIVEKEAKTVEEAMKVAERTSRWFDRRKTFFSRPLWEVWTGTGKVASFQKVAEGRSLLDIAKESIIVFPNGSRGVEYEFFVQRKENCGW